jgi:uncharacterized membrane protein YjgN (DUF898 family)
MSDYDERYAIEPAPRVRFTGLGGDFFLLQLGNLALTIITLGIYRFWGKAKYRRYLWSHTEIDGDPLEYRGTGLELFIGAILVILLISIPFGVLSFTLGAILGNPETGIAIAQFVIFLLISYLVGVGQYRSWRYMFSRTAWRGIRSGMTEQGFEYGLYNFGLTLVQFFSLGLATPWVSVKQWNRLTRDVRIGSLPLSCDADHKPLWGKYLLVWALVTVPIIAFSIYMYFRFGNVFADFENPDGPADPAELFAAIAFFYLGIIVIGLAGAALFAQYWAAYLEETINKTRIGDSMRLRIDVSTADVIKFYLGNIALSMTGIGQILLPYRNWSFMARRIWIDGSYDPRDLEQSALVGPGQGDGIADAFDVSGF